MSDAGIQAGVRELLARDPELAQEITERRALDPGPHEVGHGVQAHVKLASADAIEAVEAPDGVVSLEDADALAEVRQPDPRGEPGHAGADDGNIVVRAGVHRRD